MADTTEFTHDQLGHILSDHLLEVPAFQRSYAWDQGNVEEYLADLDEARSKNVAYFMGTVVFAAPEAANGRRRIVDGQQRLATTAVLLIAIRDLLEVYGKVEQASELNKKYIQGYEISAEGVVERLVLSPKDQEFYDKLLNGQADELSESVALRRAYDTCAGFLRKVAPEKKDYRKLIEVLAQLDNQVQVLVAVASDLPEAYVIFETLNDRGADLTTADLLKNFLFSRARNHFRYVHDKWVALEANFEKSEDLVKFIRYEYASRHGATTTRKLYRAIQGDIKSDKDAKAYVQRLSQAQTIYLALRDPEDPFWADVSVSVRDALLAYRRFGFESSMPLLIAAFQNWNKPNAARLLIKVAKWSVRAQFAGRIGASLSEDAFGSAAEALSSGEAHNQTSVRIHLARLIPTDTEFKSAFTEYGAISVARAKYVLAMLEKADDALNQRPERPLEWHTQAVTVEHVMSKAAGKDKNKEEVAVALDRIGNLALLEKRINRELGSKPFSTKVEAYRKSDFRLTASLAEIESWDLDAIQSRTRSLADLACKAWPST